MKRWLSLVMTLLLMFSATGCWGKVEVEELGFVIAIGIDAGSRPGVYDVTYQMALPAKGGQSGGDIQNVTLTVAARSMRESMEKVFSVSSRRPFVGTVKVIVLGEDLAKSGVNSVIDFFQRYYEFRRTTFLVISKGRAADLLNVKTQGEKMAGLNIQGLIHQADNTSTFPVVRLGHYLTVLSSDNTAPVIPLAYPVQSGQEGIQYSSESPGQAKEIRIAGAGVLNGDKLVSILTDEETRGYMWLENAVKQRFITAQLPNGNKQDFVSARIINASTSCDLKPLDSGGYGLHYTVKIKWDLDEYYGAQKRLTPDEWLRQSAPETTEAFAQVIQKECAAALKRSRDLGLDFLGIGRQVEEQNPTYWKEVRDHWQATLPDFPVTIDIKAKPENAGASFAPPTNPPGTGQD